MSDPIEWPRPWRDDPGAPEGARDLLGSIERPPFAPPALRHAPPPPPRTRWLGPTLATAMVLGGLVIWRLAPAPVEAPRVEPPIVPEPTAAPRVASMVPDAGEPALPPEPEPGPVDELGALTVVCRPEAAVYLDGVLVGTTPLEAFRLPPGRYQLLLRAADYDDASRTVVVRAGETTRISHRFRPPEPAPALGRLTVSTAPWAEVWVDGVPRGATPLLDLVLPAGDHDVLLLNRDAGIRETRTVTIRADETSRLDLTLEPREPGRGVLVIQTLPWARVYVDGRDTGRNTPVRELRVSAGRHVLGLRTPDGELHEEPIDVPAGETLRIVRQF